MGLTVTIIVACVVMAFTVFCGWRGAKPANKLFRPRLVPWRFLMLLSFMGWVTVMAHLVAILKPGG